MAGSGSVNSTPSGLPVLVEPLGPGVAVVGLVVVARLDPVEDQADDVVGMFAVELVLQLRADHVVGRRDHVAQRPDVAKVVAEAAKGLNFRHGTKQNWGALGIVFNTDSIPA